VADPKACADTMLTWIRAWVGAGSGSSTDVTVTPPDSSAVTGGKQFPPNATDSSPNFATTVYPLLTSFCKGCHSPTASSPQTPFFAADDVQAAYVAAQPKMDLNTPENSRFVVRLRDEHHNCWAVNGVAADCANSAAAMLKAIQDYAAGIAVTP